METSMVKGRPAAYLEGFNEQALQLCLLGAPDQQLADFFSITEVTLNRWKNKYPEFSIALKRGKIQADMQVASNLYKLANGYQMSESVTTEKDGKATTVTTVKNYPPSLSAIQYWLRNRKKDNWNNKTVINGVAEGPSAVAQGRFDGAIGAGASPGPTTRPIKLITTARQWDAYFAAKDSGLLDPNTTYSIPQTRPNDDNV
jgi:hypothetical protein